MGIGIAASTAVVILVEYLALSRLTVAVTAWPLRRVLIGIGVIMVAVGPVLLINPDKIYDDLITPSLFALWLSQLITFAVYPRFVARQGRPGGAGRGAGGGSERAGDLRPVDDHPDHFLLNSDTPQEASCRTSNP